MRTPESTNRHPPAALTPPPPVLQNSRQHSALIWFALQCSKSKQCTEIHDNDHMPVSQGYMQAQYPLLMALCFIRWGGICRAWQQGMSTVDHCLLYPPTPCRGIALCKNRSLVLRLNSRTTFFYHRTGFFVVLVDAGQLFRCAGQHYMCIAWFAVIGRSYLLLYHLFHSLLCSIDVLMYTAGESVFYQ